MGFGYPLEIHSPCSVKRIVFAFLAGSPVTLCLKKYVAKIEEHMLFILPLKLAGNGYEEDICYTI